MRMNTTRKATAALQVGIVLLGITALAFLLVEPHFEGRNVNATFLEVYFKDPFLACAYAASTLFFVALYKAYTVVGSIGRSELFSRRSQRALRTIRYCATALVGLILVAEAYLFIFQRGKDDIAGGAAIGLFLILVFGTVAILAAGFERHVRKGLSS